MVRLSQATPGLSLGRDHEPTHTSHHKESHVTTPLRTALRLEVEDFLYHEARLLDERRFHEWLDLFTEDLVY
jgi:hypothetical protein